MNTNESCVDCKNAPTTVQAMQLVGNFSVKVVSAAVLKTVITFENTFLLDINSLYCYFYYNIEQAGV